MGPLHGKLIETIVHHQKWQQNETIDFDFTLLFSVNILTEITAQLISLPFFMHIQRG